MENELDARIKSSVAEWAQKRYKSDEIVVGMNAEDISEEGGEGSVIEDDATRYLVDFAVRSVGRWLVAEVWVSDGTILSINDLGEGLPLDGDSWPWKTDRAE